LHREDVPYHALSRTAWHALAGADQVTRSDVAARRLLMLALQDVPLAHDILFRCASGCVRIRRTCRLRCMVGVCGDGQVPRCRGSAG